MKSKGRIDKIALFGHKGLIGSAILKELKKRNYKHIITAERKNLNLIKKEKVELFIKKKKPKIIIIAAARVGGIIANSNYPFNFLYENLEIQNNLISLGVKYKCKKLIFLGSSCIYPKLWKRPFREDDIALSNLEKTNEPYSIAKISGLKLCEAFNNQFNNGNPKFITIIPPNLFGPNDNYNVKNSHVLAALLRKFYEAKKKKSKYIKIWGTGKPKREVLYSEDVASVILDLLETSEKKIKKHTKGKFSHINVGSGKDFTIMQIAKMIKKISNFKGKIIFEKKYPDGVKRKLLDISLLKKISPKSINKLTYSNKEFENKIKKIFLSLNYKTFKKLEKNSSYNLSI